ncbi:MAG: hypothetical protein IID51_02015 [Proteobacteria bacterium]|nr:hypothetical protein [Pseudomonadota bacterium]
MTAGTVIKLVFLSLAVGLVLSYFGVSAANFWNSMAELAVSAWESAITFFDWAWKYILIGGAVVVPVYVLRGLSRYLRGRPGGQAGQTEQTTETREE